MVSACGDDSSSDKLGNQGGAAGAGEQDHPGGAPATCEEQADCESFGDCPTSLDDPGAAN